MLTNIIHSTHHKLKHHDLWLLPFSLPLSLNSWLLSLGKQQPANTCFNRARIFVCHSRHMWLQAALTDLIKLSLCPCYLHILETYFSIGPFSFAVSSERHLWHQNFSRDLIPLMPREEIASLFYFLFSMSVLDYCSLKAEWLLPSKIMRIFLLWEYLWLSNVQPWWCISALLGTKISYSTDSLKQFHRGKCRSKQ